MMTPEQRKLVASHVADTTSQTPWGAAIRACLAAADRCASAEAERDALRALVAELEAQIEAAETALGRAWLHGGATLAEGIARKTAAMERPAMPLKRKMPGATLTVEREDGTGETTTYGGDR